MAQDPAAWIRANPKRDDESDSEYKARYYKSTVSPETEGTAQVAPSKNREPSLGEEAVGGVRTFMNRATGGLYGKAAGALNQALGGGATAEEIAKDVKQFAGRNPRTAMATGFAGDIAPYLVGIGEAAGAARAIPGVGRALGSAETAYKAAKTVPVLRTLLPASAKTAGEIALIESARGAAGAEEGENRGVAALKSVLGGEIGGRIGEAAGTYLAGKLGPTISKQTAAAKEAALAAGEKINAFAESAGFKRADAANQALRDIYTKSKPIQEAVNAQAERLGKPIFDPAVLTEAYHDLTSTAEPRFKKEVLSPFLNAINSAFDTSLGEGIGGYKLAMDVQRAIQAGQATGKYLRKGVGDATKVGPDVLLQELSRPFVSQAEREAAAQALIASLRESEPELKRGLFRSVTGVGKGLGQIADISQQLGGTPSAMQAALQRLGTITGASR